MVPGSISEPYVVVNVLTPYTQQQTHRWHLCVPTPSLPVVDYRVYRWVLVWGHSCDEGHGRRRRCLHFTTM